MSPVHSVAVLFEVEIVGEVQLLTVDAEKTWV